MEMIKTKFKFIKTNIDGLLVIEPFVLEDNRGSFFEAYNYKDLELEGIKLGFVQDNISISKKGVLRGFHISKQFPQTKLVRVDNGAIFDCVIDCRKHSKTFGQHFSIELSLRNKKQLLIPKGFAHAFLSLDDNTVVCFKVSDYYHPNDEIGIAWNDSDIDIKWPIVKKESSGSSNVGEYYYDGKEIIVNDRDSASKSFKEVIAYLFNM